MKIIGIGMDTSKHVFQLHGIDEQGQPALRRPLQRSQVEKFFAKLPPTRIGLEACGASHHWARVLRKLGHEVVLIPPQYIKPPAFAGAGSMSSAARTMRSTPKRSVRR
jgi:transposase